MILTPQNSTNPAFWGYDLVHTSPVSLEYRRLSWDFPKECNFLEVFHKTFWPNAKEYYRAGL